MWSEERLICTLKEWKEKCNIKGNMDAKRFCIELGLNYNELVYLLSYFLVLGYEEVQKLDSEAYDLRAENEKVNELLNDMCKGNGRAIQMAKVISGLPIAKKKKKSLAHLDLEIMLGATDEDLMDYFEISKTTLWRWKKELAEKKESGKSLFF